MESHFLILFGAERKNSSFQCPLLLKKKVGRALIFIEKKKLKTPEVKQIGRLIFLFSLQATEPVNDY